MRNSALWALVHMRSRHSCHPLTSFRVKHQTRWVWQNFQNRQNYRKEQKEQSCCSAGSNDREKHVFTANSVNYRFTSTKLQMETVATVERLVLFRFCWVWMSYVLRWVNEAIKQEFRRCTVLFFCQIRNFYSFDSLTKHSKMASSFSFVLPPAKTAT